MQVRQILVLVVAASITACGEKNNESSAPAGPPAKETVAFSKDGLIIVPHPDKLHDPIPNPTPESNKIEPKRYIIWWSAEMCFDGFYALVVHPSQAFLRTENFKGNKKPDIVVWERQISDVQYHNISRFLESGASRVILPEPKRQHAGYTLFRLDDLERRVQVPPGVYGKAGLAKACNDLTVRNLEDALHELDRVNPLDEVPLLLGNISLAKMPLRILGD